LIVRYGQALSEDPSRCEAMLRDGGEAAVAPHLRDWLAEASGAGSGDDISAGLLWRAPPERRRPL